MFCFTTYHGTTLVLYVLYVVSYQIVFGPDHSWTTHYHTRVLYILYWYTYTEQTAFVLYVLYSYSVPGYHYCIEKYDTTPVTSTQHNTTNNTKAMEKRVLIPIANGSCAHQISCYKVCFARSGAQVVTACIDGTSHKMVQTNCMKVNVFANCHVLQVLVSFLLIDASRYSVQRSRKTTMGLDCTSRWCCWSRNYESVPGTHLYVGQAKSRWQTHWRQR